MPNEIVCVVVVLFPRIPTAAKVNFTLLLQPGFWFPTSEHGSNETFEEEIQRHVGYFKMPEYQVRRPNASVGDLSRICSVRFFHHLSNNESTT